MLSKLPNQLLYQAVETGPLGSVWRAATYRNSALLSSKTMRVLDEYTLSYSLSGRCTFLHPDGRTQPILPGDLFIVAPGVPHLYGVTPGHQWVELYILFKGPIFDAWRAAGVLEPHPFLRHLEPIDYWFEKLKAVVRATVETRPSESLIALCAFQSLLAEIACRDTRSSEDDDRWLANARQKIECADRADRLDLSVIADEMNTSYANFRRKFAAFAGVPPAKFHAQFLMRHACQLMHNDDVSNRELADRLGFCSEFHFSKRFLQIVGITPRKFRQSLAKPSDRSAKLTR